ncbi:proteasome accessory factor PafA2 family protein [Actinomyces capricornis]|uniref:Pup--protein ligase n=1 Tax=Actinomyces capricornis TaxID=2755559 RepID=A0ABM7U7E0_9ACTO|nr:proteasome accessory factor PafA2 family protein [Actinomyces capricornis]BDA63406.1 Pup--protein ligase [Actinomyces capricornis]
MRTPAPRVTGLETEFAILCAPTGRQSCDAPPPPDIEAAAALLFRHRPAGYRSNNLFLPNGGRLYLDVGSHPEYATAECLAVRDLVAQDQAGKAILATMATSAEEDLRSRGLSARLHLLANNTDSAGHTYGCHESYSVPRDLDEGAVLPVLAAFLATRPLLVGSGTPLAGPAEGGQQDRAGADHADQEDEDLAWALSPRAPHLRALTSADTTGQRALINTRDEPHADPARLRRLHVTCADTTIAEPTTGLRSALTLALLDALEAGQDFSDLVLADPLEVLAALGASSWGQEPVRTRDGRLLSAVDIQESFLERILAFVQRHDPPAALEGAGHLLSDLAPRVITALRRRDISGIDTEIDWAIKRRLLRAQRERHGGLGGEALAVLRSRIDLAYHDLHPQTGLAGRLEAQGAMARLCSPQERQRAQTEPPATRAQLRGAFIQACLDRGADFSVTWEGLRLDSPPTTPVDLPDPLRVQDPGAESLIGKVRSLRPEQMRQIDLVGRGGLGAPG